MSPGSGRSARSRATSARRSNPSGSYNYKQQPVRPRIGAAHLRAERRGGAGGLRLRQRASAPRSRSPTSPRHGPASSTWSAAQLIVCGHGARGRARHSQSARRRYDGERRNPWNEPECGHHYARAMSSWSGMAVLSAFRYDGPEHQLRLERKAEPSRSAVSGRPARVGAVIRSHSKRAHEGRGRSAARQPPGARVRDRGPRQRSDLRSGNNKIDCQIEVQGKLRRVSVPEVIGIREGELLELTI